MASIFIGAITRRPTGFYPFFVPVLVLIYHFVSREGGVAGGTLRAMFVTSPPRKTIFDSKKPSPLLHHSMIHLTSPFGCLLHDKILIRLHLKTKKFPARERWVTKLWIDRHSEDPNRLQHQESTHSLRGSITADLLSCLKTAIMIMLNLIQIYLFDVIQTILYKKSRIQ